MVARQNIIAGLVVARRLEAKGDGASWGVEWIGGKVLNAAGVS